MRITSVAGLLVACALACVNDYVVRNEDGAGEGDSTTDGTGAGDPTGGDGGDPDGAGMGDEAAPYECLPCESDAECGDAWDNCVMLDEVGPRCLFACPESGCPDALECRPTLSVDGVMAMQCAPSVVDCAADTGQ
jgi:hypothetical protein